MPKLGKLTLLSILSLTSSLSAFGKAKSNQPVTCQPTSYPERVTIRAMEGKGVGYNTGYTTLEGFFAFPSLMDTAWVPFIDLRGHVFNDGKTAANAGFGVRYVGASQVWGINSYYDFRHTSHRNFNQYGLGLECLGRVFDFRINGYLPFGKKESSFYGAKFDYFKGHSLFLSQKKEYAFKGANAEVGYHAKVTDDINFYTAAGPYFIDHGSRNAWGGELRVAFDFTKYIRLEGNTSYDRIFKWIGQGQVSVNIPFGPRDRIHRKGSNSCAKQLMLRDRSLQRVDRDEIIVIEKRRSHTPAIDPATGLPFFFVFVNNTSHSSGTFESPYPTLTEAEANSAPGNIILVSSGSGAAYIDQPIVLKDNQKLWGTGLSYLLKTKQGSVTIPVLS
ncbi:MAG TPA: inverse autotransporter beta domain-containing protein, partial [Rhabdochlamydiaceae bacterium]